MAGLTLALVCVAAAGLLVVMQWGVSEIGPVINQGPRQFIKARIIKEYKEWRKCGFLSLDSSCSFQLCAGVSLLLYPRGIMGGKIGSEEFEDAKGAILG